MGTIEKRCKTFTPQTLLPCTDTLKETLWYMCLLPHHTTHIEATPPPLPPVGGIYTVVRSKADVTTAELGDEYVMIGPYNESTVRLEVEVAEPDNPITLGVVEQMRSNGIKVGGTRRYAVSGSRRGRGGGGRAGPGEME